jgi:cytochrome c oxidase subunit 2
MIGLSAQIYWRHAGWNSAWTVIPVLIGCPVLASARVIASIQDPRRRGRVASAIVTGHQYWWEYRYPSLNIVSERASCAGQ